MTTKIHEGRAKEIQEDVRTGRVPSCLASRDARQGDLVLVRLGDALELLGPATPPQGELVAAGQHGEHRLIAEAISRVGAYVVDLPLGGLVVHTDEPLARHQAIALTAGRWRYHRQQELSAEEYMPVAVVD